MKLHKDFDPIVYKLQSSLSDFFQNFLLSTCYNKFDFFSKSFPPTYNSIHCCLQGLLCLLTKDKTEKAFSLQGWAKDIIFTEIAQRLIGRTGVSFSSCQRNLMKTFQIEGMIALITKMTLIFSSDLLNFSEILGTKVVQF